MRTYAELYIFLILFSLFEPVFAQTEEDVLASGSEYLWRDWQMQIIEQIDPEQFSETEYSRLMEMIYDLELQNHHRDTMPADSIFRRRLRPRQTLILSADRCLNQREGYRNPTQRRWDDSKAYLGDPIHETIRYSATLTDRRGGAWRAGLTMDKDAGERWSYRPPWSDSYSLYASYAHRRGVIRQAVVGHYRLGLGSGLICNQRFSLGKGLASSMFMSHQPSLSVHSGASEGGYMQGAAARLRLGTAWEVLPFVSVRQIDGTLENDTLRSWSEGGYHRTRGEESKRNSSWLTQCGMRTQWMGEWFVVGGSALYSQFRHTYYRPVLRYNADVFRGHQLLQGSVDYEARWMGFHLKGESAVDDGGGWATVHAVQYDLHEQWLLTALYREYSDKYRQLSGNSISESSAMQGERGVTLSAESDVFTHWHLAVNADWFRFSAPQYGIYQPSQGYELSGKAIWNRRRHHHEWQGSLHYRMKAKYRNNTLTDSPTDISPYYRHSADGQLRWISPLGLEMKAQAHSRFYSAQNVGGVTCGYSFSQAIGWKRDSSPWMAEVQGTWFHTDDYDTRVYISERNVLYGFGIPMLYGEGIRWSALFRYDIGRRWTFYAKYGMTQYKGVSSVGSGLQQVRGNSLSTAAMELIWKI